MGIAVSILLFVLGLNLLSPYSVTQGKSLELSNNNELSMSFNSFIRVVWTVI